MKINKIIFIVIVFFITIAFSSAAFAVETNGAAETYLDSIEVSVPVDIDGAALTGKDLKVYNIVSNTPNYYSEFSFSPAQRENIIETDEHTISLKEYLFENGDYYWMKRFEYKTDIQTPYLTSFTIPGDSIEIRYVDPNEKQWVNTSVIENLPNTMLYIDTDRYHMLISVAAVYNNSFEANTLQIMRELEKPLKIEKLDGEYKISAEFEQKTDLIGEIWVLQSVNQLVDWTQAASFTDLIDHDLSIERRWSWDGYYFTIPYNYIPNGENFLYRNPANFTGSSWVRNGSNFLMKDMGYVMTQTCMKNQNSEGYWPTGPKSLWLEEDFGIGAGFYDTRFNTDFATSLLAAYQNYGNTDFLTSAVNYAEYYMDFSEKNHYETESGGWLVEDYAGGDVYARTHVSLNHQLAEMNFLYELYNITGEESYIQRGDLMLLGIEDTKNQWVLEDNNLAYALMYTGTANVMVDYPYLTYNDLYKTRDILNKYFNRTSEAVEYLMSCKKQWMDNNNVTGYYGYIMG